MDPGSEKWVRAVSLDLAVSNGFSGCFGPKRAVFGPELRKFGRAPPDFALAPRVPSVNHLEETLSDQAQAHTPCLGVVRVAYPKA